MKAIRRQISTLYKEQSFKISLPSIFCSPFPEFYLKVGPPKLSLKFPFFLLFFIYLSYFCTFWKNIFTFCHFIDVFVSYIFNFQELFVSEDFF